MEMVNGFPSFSVVSCHLAFTFFALRSLTVLRHSACATARSPIINKQMSNLKLGKAMFASRRLNGAIEAPPGRERRVPRGQREVTRFVPGEFGSSGSFPTPSDVGGRQFGLYPPR